MRAGGAALKRKVGRPRTVTIAARPDPWNNAEIAAEVRKVLESFEDVPPIESEVRLTLQRWLYRQDKYFGGGGAGSITLVLRVFLDSDVNRGALAEPILCAVSFVSESRFARYGLRLYDALDQIDLSKLAAAVRDAQRDLGPEVFRGSFSETLSIALRRKVVEMLEPPVAKPVKVRPARKPPLSVTRIPAIEKNIALGVELLALRAAIPGNAAFGRQARSRFDVDQMRASQVMRVARLYADRPEIYRAASWRTLVELASPKMAPAVRQAFEAKVIAGQSITAPQIRRTRGPLKSGCPVRQAQSGGPCRKERIISSRPAARMAA